MTTTFEQIRDRQATLIEALTPAHHAGRRFLRHREGDFMAWVEKYPGACFRRFQILANLDPEILATADGSIEGVRHTMDLRVAYPLAMGKYGPENERDFEDLLAADFRLINGAIGINGGNDYVTNQDLCAFQSQVAVPVADGAAAVISITFLVQYDRSV